MSIFTKVWAYLKEKFTHITIDIAKVAVTITQHIRTVLESPQVGFVAKILDELKFHGLASEVLVTLKNSVVKVLSIELAIQLPSGDITSEEFIAWEQKVMDALGVHKDQSAIWTKVSTTIIRDYQAFTKDGSAVTFAEGVSMAEDAWNAYKEATK